MNQGYCIVTDFSQDSPNLGAFHQFRSLYGVEYLTVDETFTILEHSNGIERFADEARSLSVGRSIFAGLPELVGCEARLEAVLQQQEAPFELKLLTRDRLYFNFYGIRSSAAHLTVFLVDVTEQVQLERDLVQGSNEAVLRSQQLQSSHAYTEQVLYSIPNAIIATTYAGTIRLVNAVAEKFLGYSQAELVGASIATYLPGLKPMFLGFSAHNPKFFSCQLLKDVHLVGYTKAQKQLPLLVSCASVQSENALFQGWVLTLQEQPQTAPSKPDEPRYNQYIDQRRKNA
jgi:PAS domain-containing protein